MTPEELDEARAKEAERIWDIENSQAGTLQELAIISARLAREGWTPPEPVDPDILAFREWMVGGKLAYDSAQNRVWREEVLAGKPEWDQSPTAHGFVAGARMAREQERERFNHPVAFAVRVMAGAFKDLDSAKREAREVLAKIPGRTDYE